MILNIPQIDSNDEFHLLIWGTLALKQKEMFVLLQTLRVLDAWKKEGKEYIICKPSNIAKALGIVSIVECISQISNILSKLDRLGLIFFQKKRLVTEIEQGAQKSQLCYAIKTTLVSFSTIISNLKDEYNEKLKEEEDKRNRREEARARRIDEGFEEYKRECLEKQKLSKIAYSSIIKFSNFNSEFEKIH